MKTSDRGVALIKSFEGLRLRAYQDQGGVWTVGWGHTRTAKDGLVVTRQQAERLLKADIELTERGVDAALRGTVLTQLQYDAIVSMVFNIGVSAFAKSKVLKLLKAGDYREAAAQMLAWHYVKKVPNAGLMRRRQAERELFLEGTHDDVDDGGTGSR